METLAALSLAGNVVQFVQFACRVVGKTCHIYSSASGASTRTQHLDYIHNHLIALYSSINVRYDNADELSGTRSIKSHVALSDASPDYAFMTLVTRSKEIGQKLLGMIDQLKLKNGEKNTRWKSFKRALIEARTQDEVGELEKQLEDIQSAIVLHLCAAST